MALWRVLDKTQTNEKVRTVTVRTLTIVVGGGGFEPPKSETSDLQSDAFGHSAIRPYLVFYPVRSGGVMLELVIGIEPTTC